MSGTESTDLCSAVKLPFLLSTQSKLFLCRLCLCKNGTLCDIYCSKIDNGVTVAKVISELLGCKVSSSDHYPQLACLGCVKRLVEFKSFKESCKNAKSRFDEEFRSKMIFLEVEKPSERNNGNLLIKESPDTSKEKQSGVISKSSILLLPPVIPNQDYRNFLKKKILDTCKEKQPEVISSSTISRNPSVVPIQNNGNLLNEESPYACKEKQSGVISNSTNSRISSDIPIQNNVNLVKRELPDRCKKMEPGVISNSKSSRNSSVIPNQNNENLLYKKSPDACKEKHPGVISNSALSENSSVVPIQNIENLIISNNRILSNSSVIPYQSNRILVNKEVPSISKEKQLEVISNISWKKSVVRIKDFEKLLLTPSPDFYTKKGPEGILNSAIPLNSSVSPIQNNSNLVKKDFPGICTEVKPEVISCVPDICMQEQNDQLKKEIVVKERNDHLSSNPGCSSHQYSDPAVRNVMEFIESIYKQQELAQAGAVGMDNKINKYYERKQCDLCNKSFSNVHGLKRHMLREHTEKKFQCSLCPKRFSTEVFLNSHAVKHRELRPFHCKICKSGFFKEQYLQKHLSRHALEVPFVCDHCGKTFDHKRKLWLHIHRSHLIKHACSICNKEFSTSAYLQVHMTIHTGEKKHMCEVCGKTFRQRNTYKIHIRQHTGEKPYHCTLCDKRFTQRVSMKGHMKLHHP